MTKKRALPLVVILAFLCLPTPSQALPLMGVGLIRQLVDVSEFVVRVLVGPERRVRGEKPQAKAGSCTDPDGRSRPCQ